MTKMVSLYHKLFFVHLGLVSSLLLYGYGMVMIIFIFTTDA